MLRVCLLTEMIEIRKHLKKVAPEGNPPSWHPGKNVHFIPAPWQQFFLNPALNKFPIPYPGKSDHAIPVSRQTLSGGPKKGVVFQISLANVHFMLTRELKNKSEHMMDK